MSPPRRPPSPTSSHSPCRSPNLNSASSTTTFHLSPPPHAYSPMSDEDDSGLPPTSPVDNRTKATTPSPPHLPSPNTTELLSLPPPPLSSTATRTPSFPGREDCWSEEATHTLIDAWGSHYLELNRGNLRQKHWQEVADAVNAIHAHTKKLQRTDIQCKNRIDTLKKKYKIEKSKFLESNGRYVSPWPFFTSLDSLIGDTFVKAVPPSPSPPPPKKNFQALKNSPSPAPARKDFLALPPPPSSVPVGPRSKRPAPTIPVTPDEALFRRNFSAMAAAAAAVEAGVEDEEEDDDEEESETSSAVAAGVGRRKRKRPVVVGRGYKKLAEAIARLGEIYERVEEAKQRQMVELEKQRMQFAKDLEIQRMKLFMESQVHLKKLKRSKRSSQSDGYS